MTDEGRRKIAKESEVSIVSEGTIAGTMILDESILISVGIDHRIQVELNIVAVVALGRRHVSIAATGLHLATITGTDHHPAIATEALSVVEVEGMATAVDTMITVLMIEGDEVIVDTDLEAPVDSDEVIVEGVTLEVSIYRRLHLIPFSRSRSVPP